MKNFTIIAFIIFFNMPSYAGNFVTGSTRVDNFHQLYTGDESGSLITEHSSGVISFGGSPAFGIFDFETTDDYIYLVAWSDDGVQQYAIAELGVDGVDVSSGISPDWEVYPTGIDFDGLAGPAAALVSSEIASAIWSPVTTTPSSTVANPGALTADAMWFDSGATTVGCNPVITAGDPFCAGFDHGEFMIFRHPIPKTITGTTRVDNFHQLYTGDAAGVSLTEQSSGVISFAGSPAFGFFDFSTTDDYIYLVAWSDDGVQQYAIAELRVGGGNIGGGVSPDWEVFPTGIDFDGLTGPTPAVVSTQIALATWSAVATTPSSTVVNTGDLLSDAMWFDSGATTVGCNPAIAAGDPFCAGFDHGEFLIFRHPVAVPSDPHRVPAMSGVSLIGLVALLTGLALVLGRRRLENLHGRIQ